MLDISKLIPYLNMSGLIILQKVPDKQTLPLALHESIVTLSRASGGSTCRTHSAGFLANQGSTTWTLRLLKAEQGAVTSIKCLIFLITWCFHSIEHVETPIDGMMHLDMIVGTNVAHSGLTCQAVLQSFNVGEFSFLMDLAIRNVLCN